MKIGVMVESFKKDLTYAASAAKRLGANGLQAYANSQTINENLSKKDISEIKKMLDDNGLEFSALCGDFGCKMYYEPETSRELIEREKKVLDLAKQLGTNIVTTHIGVVTEETNTRQYENMHKVCLELAKTADSLGGHFAVETGPEKAVILKSFLDSLNSKGVGVNLDPANLVMCAGDDPVKAVITLKDYIVHTHAKDGIQLRQTDTRRIYAPSYYGLEPEKNGECFLETPLGDGGVDWQNYIKALKSINYNGYLTVEREVGLNPEADIEKAVTFLKKYL